MQRRTARKRAFSLVELLAVVQVLLVLAGVAIPAYLNTRKTSAARACKANIATIAAVESSYAMRFGSYKGSGWDTAYTAASTTGGTPTGGLVGAPEGLAEVPACPLRSATYACTVSSSTLTITCNDVAQHAVDANGAASTSTATTAQKSPWTKTLSPAGVDNTSPL